MNKRSGLILALVGLAIALAWRPAAVHAITVPLPAEVNYNLYAAGLIGSSPFATDPTLGRVAGTFDITPYYGPAPSCSLEGSLPNMKIFLINQNMCVKEGDTLTYKVQIENGGDQTAYNLHIEIKWVEEAAKLLNSTIPEYYVGNSDSAEKEFHETPNPLIPIFEFPGHTDKELNFTLLVLKALKPFTVSLHASYYDCQGRKDRYACLQECIPNCVVHCEEERGRCKNSCVNTNTQCLNDCQSWEQQCVAGCASNKDPAACAKGCQDAGASCRNGCGAAKITCDNSCDAAYEGCKTNCFNGCEPVCARDHFVDTEHSIRDSCDPAPEFTTTPFAGQPNIICEPAEIHCAPSKPDRVGPNFDKAQYWNFDGAKPDLGPRYKEAYADIKPGECSVVADDIIVQPPFQDALNRQAQIVDVWMRPLHDSGTDFGRIVIENEILNIKHKAQAKKNLLEKHLKLWLDVAAKIDQILAGQINASQLQLGQLIEEARQKVLDEQKQLSKKYGENQDKKKDKFDPAAETAVNNAIQSICRACPDCGSDGGLKGLLPAVKTKYEANLDARKQAFDDMQQQSGIAPMPWAVELQNILSGYTSSNSKPLRDFRGRFPANAQDEFEEAWQYYYEKHYSEDKAKDIEIRLNEWEVALDTPKMVATMCTKKRIFAAKVEESWCESDGYPEFIIRGAPKPAKADYIVLPNQINNGKNSDIDPRKVIGDVCGGKSGDPYWADDCSCHCEQIIPDSGPNMRFCGTGGRPPAGDDDPGEPEVKHPITQHDINITSREECLQNIQPRHEGDPFL